MAAVSIGMGFGHPFKPVSVPRGPAHDDRLDSQQLALRLRRLVDERLSRGFVAKDPKQGPLLARVDDRGELIYDDFLIQFLCTHDFLSVGGGEDPLAAWPLSCNSYST